MISYELAKKLKDAGFPQDRDGDGYELGSNGLRRSYQSFDDFLEYAYAPTLSELIEACGDEVRLQSYWSENDLMWQADNSSNFYVKENQIAGVGSTPEEAVALLYLAINGNNI